jgi:hypothetical protein
MGTAAAIGSVAAPIIGGVLGEGAARGERQAAERATEQALAMLAGVPIPGIEEQELLYEMPEFLEEYRPILEEGVEIAPSAMEEIAIDPRLRSAQMMALQQLTGEAEGGLTPADVAAMDIARRQSAGQERARQEQILQEMAARGMGGSGAEMVARLQSSQAAANALAEAQARQAMAAQQARQQAVRQMGQLGGQIRGQEFGEQAKVAGAQDVINKFRAQLQSGQQARNIAAQQAAQQRNIGERQRIAEQQAALRNAQQEANKALLQQQFLNRLAVTKPQTEILKGEAAGRRGAAAGIAQSYAGIGSHIGSGLGTLGGLSGGSPSQPNLQQQLNQVDRDIIDQRKYLEGLTGKKVR